MRADLHIHTTASDGTWDPGQVVKAVCAAGIEFFAVTDHDSVDNVAETKKLAADTGLGFITGVELNSTKDGHNYHILGYGIDIENKRLRELCRHNQRLLELKDDDSVRNLDGAAAMGITPILIAANPASDVETSYLKIKDLRELIR